MCLIVRANNADSRMSAMQPRAVQFSEIPLLCFRDQKVAEDLDARD
jgi:hypothetical protein